MKKYLITSILVLSMLTLVSCGKSEVVDSPIPGEVSIESVVENTQEPVIEVPEKTTEDATKNTTEDTVKIEEVVNESEETKNETSETVELTEEVKEEVSAEVKYVLTLAKDSSLETNPEFNGLYKVTGYSRMSFGSMLTFQIDVKSVFGENEGSIDASKAGLVDNILDFVDYIYFDLTFKDNQIVDWNVVDNQTFESVASLTEEELTNRYFPEVNYELVPAGALPKLINLSDYGVGKTYVFDAPDEENFEPPAIVNDTDYPLLITSIKNGIDEDFEREYKLKHVAPDTSVSSTYSDDGKYYVAVIEGNPSTLMNSDECLKLEGYNVGDELDFDFEDFVGNNTTKTITLVVSDWGVENEFTLLPGEILECSWMNDVSVKSIN